MYNSDVYSSVDFLHHTLTLLHLSMYALILSAVHIEDCISCDCGWCSQLLHIHTGSDHAGCIPCDTMVLPQDSKGDQEA